MSSWGSGVSPRGQAAQVEGWGGTAWQHGGYNASRLESARGPGLRSFASFFMYEVAENLRLGRGFKRHPRKQPAAEFDRSLSLEGQTHCESDC